MKFFKSTNSSYVHRAGRAGPTTPTLVEPKSCHLWSKPCNFSVHVGPIIVKLRFFSNGQTKLNHLPPLLVRNMIENMILTSCSVQSYLVHAEVENVASIQIGSCDKLKYQVSQQFCLATDTFVLRHIFDVVSEVTVHLYCKTLRYGKRHIFSLITYEPGGGGTLMLDQTRDVRPE